MAELHQINEDNIARISRFMTDTQEAIKSDRDKWQDQWDEKYRHYTENLRLATTVDHWKKRGLEHESKYKVIRW